MMKTMIKEGGWNASSWAVKEQALQASRDHWAALSQSWKEEPDMALAAIKGRIVTDLRDLPDALRMDRAFLIQAIRVRPRTWLTLSEPFAHDVEMAKIIPQLDPEIARAVFSRFPCLQSDRHFWLQWLTALSQSHNQYSTTNRELPRLMRQYATDAILNDETTMVQAVRVSGECLSLAGSTLFHNRTFVAHVLNPIDPESRSNPELLQWISHPDQQRWPELVAGFIEQLTKAHDILENAETAASEVSQYVAPALWKDQNVLLQWFQSGRPFVCHHFPVEMQQDEEAFLLLAECARENDHSIGSFRYASKILRDNKTFMMKAVGHNAFAFHHASPGLQNDFDLLLVALARSAPPTALGRRAFANTCVTTKRQGASFWFELQSRMERKLAVHVSFTQTFLPAIRVDRQLPLSLLNQGSDTTMGFTQRMAEFLDAPDETQLLMIQRIFGMFDDHGGIYQFACQNIGEYAKGWSWSLV